MPTDPSQMPSPMISAADAQVAPLGGSRSGEADLYDFIENLRQDATTERNKQAHFDQWPDWLDGWWGEVWPHDLPTFRPPIVVNELQTILLQETSELTDTQIRVYVQKTSQSAKRDNLVERAIMNYWQRNFVDYQLILAILDAFIYPCGFLTCLYDPTVNGGCGDLVIRARHPGTVIPDPDCSDDERWRYVLLHDVLDLVEIQEAWPEHGLRVKPDDNYSIKFPPGTNARGPSGSSGRYMGPIYGIGTGAAIHGYMKARAGVTTCFIQDGTIEDEVIEQVDPATQTTLMKLVKRKKYPHGRLIQCANGVVLFDGPNRYMPRFPVVRILMQPAIHQFWPANSPVGMVLEIYKAANKLDSLVVENGLRLNGGTLIADTTSGINPATYANIPGQALLKPPGSQVDIKYPPPMPADMVQAGDNTRAKGARVLGYSQSRIGAGARGNVSAELTETEISQSMGLTRLRARLLHMSVQKVVESLFGGMATFYAPGQPITYLDAEEFHLEEWQTIADPSAYRVHVDPASFQTKSKTMLQRLYLTLAKFGKIPHADLLEMLDIPNAKQVAERLNQQLQLEAMVKQKGKKR